MTRLMELASAGISLLALNLTVLAVGALETYAQPSPVTTFSDVQSGYWAQPFIRGLAARNIVVGYPDGTFRPEQPVQRDEFAAIIRKAFDQPPIRQIESGAVYKDIPANYWAVRPIEEAYQQGFMSGLPGGYFRPNQPVSKVEAIVALDKGLNLTAGTSAATEPTVTPQRIVPQQSTRRATKRPIFLPLAITSLMQPLLIPQAQAAPANVATPSTTEEQAANLKDPASLILNKTYTDAHEIPQYATGSVVAATKENIVVNYPNSNVLNPTKPATRGEIAGLVYQTLAAQNKIEPLADNLPVNQYIVRAPINDQNVQ
ncbi:S-layer homology domain-containing protein [Anabaena sp. UHCC 0399]|uniref:S-layer homology domain-containing protein n=1 Tax=Anabaena sp. UHCC 0399 TaxID=3110238 RepID=UPI002B1FB1D3|nr:S-layer homology domain-containing protein [Anabaena sp. UHCC 0399]MEA5568978.1 S-layer homology domain-containing protein [Anabaena sp. UHCC 0399]